MTRVALIKLTRRYGKVTVVDLDLPLELKPGELVFVLGPSLAGKSTLARLIAGLEPSDDGEVYFDGRLMNGVPAAERRVGLMLQGDSLWPHMTVAENVGFGLRYQGVGRAERRRRVAEALGSARIDSLADRRPDSLTPLQRKRAELARALVIEPQFVVLDEPMAGLDELARAEFRDEIRRLQVEHEVTTLVLTSEPREALAMADRVAVMDLGRLLQVGVPQEVYNRPVDAFVARFLGRVNLLQGQVEGLDGRGDLVVRTPIGRLIGRSPSGPLPTGLPVTVAIRPDALALGPSVPPGSNRFAASVERQVFLGEVREVYLRGPGDWPVTALTLQGLSAGLREGQSLTVSVPPEFVVVLRGKHATIEPGPGLDGDEP